MGEIDTWILKKDFVGIFESRSKAEFQKVTTNSAQII